MERLSNFLVKEFGKLFAQQDNACPATRNIMKKKKIVKATRVFNKAYSLNTIHFRSQLCLSSSAFLHLWLNYFPS